MPPPTITWHSCLWWRWQMSRSFFYPGTMNIKPPIFPSCEAVRIQLPGLWVEQLQKVPAGHLSHTLGGLCLSWSGQLSHLYSSVDGKATWGIHTFISSREHLGMPGAGLCGESKMAIIPTLLTSLRGAKSVNNTVPFTEHILHFKPSSCAFSHLVFSITPWGLSFQMKEQIQR